MRFNIKVLAILLTGLFILTACGKKDKSNSEEKNGSEGYDVTAVLKFSSGETLDFKAHSVTPSIADPFIDEDGDRLLTSGYIMRDGDLLYRLNIKTKVKDEPGTYDSYKKEEDYLEAYGVYFEFTITSQDGSRDELYRLQYTEAESGNFSIKELSKDRLSGTFEAVLPFMPLEPGKTLTLTKGKIDITIQRV